MSGPDGQGGSARALDGLGVEVKVDLAAIWLASRGILQEQVDVIERAVVAGIERRLDLEGQRDAGREAHKLAGSLGTFGFDEASRLARTLELALAATELIEPAQALELSRLVVDLQAELAHPVPALHSRPPSGPMQAGSATLLVVDADRDAPRRVIETAARQGLRAISVTTIGAARDLLETAPPDVVVVDADVAAERAVAAFLAELADHEPAIVAVVLVGHAGLSERVQAARAGALVVLEKPAPPDAVVEAAVRLLAREQVAATVLAVDDDPIFLVLIRELLGAQGLSVECLKDAGKLWDALEAVEPDLLLLDNDMPGVDGISLCRAIRSDERWAQLPVVFLSGSDSPDVVQAMFSAGADDFVSKPVSPDALINRVANRIRRSRTQTERPDVDRITGLPSASAFVEDANRLLSLALQDARPAALAVTELAPPDKPALVAFGRLLRQSFEAEDAVGAWSGGRLAALMYGVTGLEARARLEPVLHAARVAGGAAPSRAIVGVAVCPDDGSDVRALGVAAETALGRARRATGDAVELHELPGRGRVEVVDVLLVDDDQALSTLVVHALSAQGWSVRWVQDGAEAVELLDDPGFGARAILLDVGLPGLDGLSVLRHLAQRGQLDVTRVVMLTVRANEGEVLQALDLGAFDHVAKPFSLAVLVHRVRRAIEASG